MHVRSAGDIGRALASVIPGIRDGVVWQRYEGQHGSVDLSIRDATTDDYAAIADIYRRASLWNQNDRDKLLAQPELLSFDVGWVTKQPCSAWDRLRTHRRLRHDAAHGRMLGRA